MEIEVDMALGLVFNTQAVVRHLQDGRWKPVTHDLVPIFFFAKLEKLSDSSPLTNNWSRARPSRMLAD
jgi:hypothetical protein